MTCLWCLPFLGRVLLCSIWFCPWWKFLCPVWEVDICDPAGQGVRVGGDVTGHRLGLQSRNHHDDSISYHFPGGGCWSMPSLSGVVPFPTALALANVFFCSKRGVWESWWETHLWEKPESYMARISTFRKFRRAHSFWCLLSFPFWWLPFCVSSWWGASSGCGQAQAHLLEQPARRSSLELWILSE